MTLPRGSIYKLCGLLLWLIGAIAASVWMAVHEEWILMSFCLIVGVVAVVKIIRFHFQNIRKLTYLFDSIENGDYAGGRIPPLRKLAEDMGVSYETVRGWVRRAGEGART